MVKWTCNLGCTEPIETDDLEVASAHIQLFHPEVYGSGPERWPDGSIVVTDYTLAPEDFG